MKIVFMGTPDFAVPCLEKLIADGKHRVLAAVTQPDRPRDRGVVSCCPTKNCALAHGITVLQYEKVSREGIEEIKALNPDAIVTAAFGQMLSREFLEIAKYGVINVHASLLPKYRGSSPIQWAVINGEEETGVTIMKTAYKMDSGDIILQKRTAIGGDETSCELFERLSAIGAEALAEALDLIEAGTATYTPQNEEEATYFPMLKKEDGEINFNMTASEIKHRVLGFNPWPTAYTALCGKKLKFYKVSETEGEGAPGEVLQADKNGLIVACGKGALNVEVLQPENGKRMAAKDYLLGHKIETGTILGK